MRALLLIGMMLVMAGTAQAGPLRDMWMRRHQGQAAQTDNASVTLTRDVAYGPDAAQKFDVYAPKNAHNAPVIVFVHGGGWRIGDKTMGRVVDNKMNHWTGMGAIFVSVNYRMLPTDVYSQAQDVAAAIAAIRTRAEGWGSDASRIVLSGHSAGAHLIMLVTSDTAFASQAGPWRATVALDSAAYDVVKLMGLPHMSLYDDAFGTDATFWHKTSPYDALSAKTPPALLVCSSKRQTSCATAQEYLKKAQGFGSTIQVLPEDLTHEQINETLGESSAYTAAVDDFLKQQGVF